jgi:hypothetical protein
MYICTMKPNLLEIKSSSVDRVRAVARQKMILGKSDFLYMGFIYRIIHVEYIG